MIEREIADFDLEQIARSGQCFRFRELGEKRYSVVAGGKYIEVCQEGRLVRFDCSEETFESVWRGYFDLDADYGRYKRAVAKREDVYKRQVRQRFHSGGARVYRCISRLLGAGGD